MYIIRFRGSRDGHHMYCVCMYACDGAPWDWPARILAQINTRKRYSRTTETLVQCRSKWRSKEPSACYEVASKCSDSSGG